jgi:hypothetical protein
MSLEHAPRRQRRHGAAQAADAGELQQQNAELRRQLHALERRVDDEVLTFAEWCALNGFGERTGRRVLAASDGPTVTMLSMRRIGITRRNNHLWQEARARQKPNI